MKRNVGWTSGNCTCPDAMPQPKGEGSEDNEWKWAGHSSNWKILVSKQYIRQLQSLPSLPSTCNWDVEEESWKKIMLSLLNLKSCLVAIKVIFPIRWTGNAYKNVFSIWSMVKTPAPNAPTTTISIDLYCVSGFDIYISLWTLNSWTHLCVRVCGHVQTPVPTTKCNRDVKHRTRTI